MGSNNTNAVCPTHVQLDRPWVGKTDVISTENKHVIRRAVESPLYFSFARTLPNIRVPHLRDGFIVAKVGLVCGSKRPLPTHAAGCPTHAQRRGPRRAMLAGVTERMGGKEGSLPLNIGCPSLPAALPPQGGVSFAEANDQNTRYDQSTP